MDTAVPELTKKYVVNKIDGKLTITGEGNDPHWRVANSLGDFSYPWENVNPHPTFFRALHNHEWLYCQFEVADPHIRIFTHTNDKTEVIHSDRVEIFFRTSRAMSPYYCLEIDPLARVFDCKGEHYRKLDSSWQWPREHLIVKASQNSDGYVVELAISKQSLQQLDLIKSNRIECGLFRADCTVINGSDSSFRWISWIKPQSSEPDFHIPSAFGLLVLD